MLVKACNDAKDSVQESAQKITGKRTEPEKKEEGSSPKKSNIMDRIKLNRKKDRNSESPQRKSEKSEPLEPVKIGSEGLVISLNQANNNIRKKPKLEENKDIQQENQEKSENINNEEQNPEEKQEENDKKVFFFNVRNSQKENAM